MKKYLIRLIGFFGLMLSFSSCSMDKRLYSTGFNIQWNVGVGEPSKVDGDKSKKEQMGTFFAAKTASQKSELIAIEDDCQVNQFSHPETHQSFLQSNSYNKNQVFHSNQIANSTRPLNPSSIVSARFNAQNISAIAKPKPGESIEQKAKRKANKALIYGIISFLTFILYFIGFPFGVIAIILGLQARKLAEDNGPIKKRANAGIIWAIIGITLAILFLLLLLAYFGVI